MGRPAWAILAIALLAVLLVPLPGSRQSPSRRTLRVEAASYAYAPSVLEVAYGDTVQIELVSTDVVHGIHIEGYDLSVSADPGQTALLQFVADRRGSFRFYCSVSCGPLHPFMSGRLRVGGRDLFWRAAGLALIGAMMLVFARWR